MNVMALFDWTNWVVIIIDPRSWGIAAIAVFAWRPFLWPRRLLLALAVYLALAIAIEALLFKTFFGSTLYAQLLLGLIVTALWFWVFQAARRAFTKEQ